eukprot:m.344329 g.344329  ORF g.344329 m.344329 type:complete len:77 (+) comp20645_c0_seq2:4578-4808(+)
MTSAENVRLSLFDIVDGSTTAPIFVDLILANNKCEGSWTTYNFIVTKHNTTTFTLIEVDSSRPMPTTWQGSIQNYR